MITPQARQTLDEFKALVKRNDDKAYDKLRILKEILLELDSLPPLCVESPTAREERAFARDFYEYAVIMSINDKDKDSFQRYMSCLKGFYTQFAKESTELYSTVLGLNLLYLLIENRLADFHCELELLSEEEKRLPTVAFCTQLDKHLVMGSYDQVLAAAASPPSQFFVFFLTSLLETVRINIGECVAASYPSIGLAAITKLLMFDDQADTLEFVSTFYPGWVIDNSKGMVLLNSGTKAAKSEEIPSYKLISQNLAYATELERIV